MHALPALGTTVRVRCARGWRLQEPEAFGYPPTAHSKNRRLVAGMSTHGHCNASEKWSLNLVIFIPFCGIKPCILTRKSLFLPHRYCSEAQ